MIWGYNKESSFNRRSVFVRWANVACTLGYGREAYLFNCRTIITSSGSITTIQMGAIL